MSRLPQFEVPSVPVPVPAQGDQVLRAAWNQFQTRWPRLVGGVAAHACLAVSLVLFGTFAAIGMNMILLPCCLLLAMAVDLVWRSDRAPFSDIMLFAGGGVQLLGIAWGMGMSACAMARFLLLVVQTEDWDPTAGFFLDRRWLFHEFGLTVILAVLAIGVLLAIALPAFLGGRLLGLWRDEWVNQILLLAGAVSGTALLSVAGPSVFWLVEHNCGPWEALRKGFAILRCNLSTQLLIGPAMAFALTFAGALPAGVGLFATIPFWLFLQAVGYLMMTDQWPESGGTFPGPSARNRRFLTRP